MIFKSVLEKCEKCDTLGKRLKISAKIVARYKVLRIWKFSLEKLVLNWVSTCQVRLKSDRTNTVDFLMIQY